MMTEREIICEDYNKHTTDHTSEKLKLWPHNIAPEGVLPESHTSCKSSSKLNCVGSEL